MQNITGLVIIVVRWNIVTVKFNLVLIIKNKLKNYKNIFTKKNIFMDININYAQYVMPNYCLTPYDNIKNLKGTNSLIIISHYILIFLFII